MTDSTGHQSAQPGWYADPSGLPQHRWWDGTRWTDHVHAPAHEPVAQQPADAPAWQQPATGQGQQASNWQQQQQPWPQQNPANWPQQAAWSHASEQVDPGTSVYNGFIWAIVLMPLLSVIGYASFDIRGYMIRSMSGVVALDPMYILLSLLGLAIYIVTIILSYFDYRKLERDGFVRPFHWAWSFLSSTVYVIGRSVIVKRRAGRGLAMLWVWAGVTALLVIVAVVKTLGAIAAMLPYLPGYAT